MKSKWLDWTPGSEIIEKNASPEPTKPSKPGLAGFVGMAPAHSYITRDSKAPSGRTSEGHQSNSQVASDGIASDPYAERLGAAMREVGRPDYPAGLIPWLGETNPRLYAELTERLPEDIQRLWEAHAPLEQFEKVLAHLLDAHRSACAVYKAHLEARQRSPRKETSGS